MPHCVLAGVQVCARVERVIESCPDSSRQGVGGACHAPKSVTSGSNGKITFSIDPHRERNHSAPLRSFAARSYGPLAPLAGRIVCGATRLFAVVPFGHERPYGAQSCAYAAGYG